MKVKFRKNNPQELCPLFIVGLPSLKAGQRSTPENVGHLHWRYTSLKDEDQVTRPVLLHNIADLLNLLDLMELGTKKSYI